MKRPEQSKPTTADVIAAAAAAHEVEASDVTQCIAEIERADDISSVPAMKKLVAELERCTCASEQRSGWMMTTRSDDMVLALVMCTEKLFGNKPIAVRVFKHSLHLLVQIFMRKWLIETISKDALHSLLSQLLARLLDMRLSDVDRDQSLHKALNSLVLKVLENATYNHLFSVLLWFLHSDDRIPTSITVEQRPKFTDSVLRCLLKLTKNLSASILDVNIDQLLCDVHLFLVAHPPAQYRGSDFMPLRLIKTILNELVKLKGEEIRNHMSLVPLDRNPTILSYIDLLLRNGRPTAPVQSSAVPMSGPAGDVLMSQPKSSADAAAVNHYPKLAQLLKDIGDSMETATADTVPRPLWDLHFHLLQHADSQPAFDQLMTQTGESFKAVITDGLSKCRAADGSAEHKHAKLQALRRKVNLATDSDSFGSDGISLQSVSMRSVGSSSMLSESGSATGGTVSALQQRLAKLRGQGSSTPAI